MNHEDDPAGRRADFQAARQPKRWAACHDDDVLTWAELAERALRRANALFAAGVRQDDLVALALPNSNAVYELTFAIWKLGATPLMLSARLPRAELDAVLEVAGARLVITHDPALITAPFTLPAEFGRDHADRSPRATLQAKHWKAITSGGSTGRPKVIVDHRSSLFEMSAGSLMLPTDGVILNPAPLYHNFPFALTHVAMIGGCSVIGMPKFDAERMLQLIAHHKVQWINLVPTMMGRVARLPADVRARYDMSSLETIWHTGAPIPAWLKELWIEWLGPERIWEMYGGSEGFCTTQLNGAEWLAHRGSVGRPAIGEVTIRGEDGAMLAVGEVGEIFMRGPAGVTPTYHYRGADSRRLADGFESLGDYGWLDADGYLYIADRRSDMIVSGGSNVYPAEVEAALMAHPAVETAVVIGLPHADLGAAPHAIIRTEPGKTPPSEQELRAFIAERLVRYKTPRSYEFTDRPLRDEAGKVRRSALREERLPTAAKPLDAPRHEGD